MLDVAYSVKGVEQVRQDLSKLSLASVQDTVSAILDDMKQEAGQYPPPPPNSTYLRTDRLKLGWLDSQPVLDLSGDTLLGSVVNSTSYGPYVQGQEDQAIIHQGRWQTVEALMDAWEERAASRIEDALVQKVGT